jgi:hypothetical protein
MIEVAIQYWYVLPVTILITIIGGYINSKIKLKREIEIDKLLEKKL